MTDRMHIKRIRSALRTLLAARRYNAQAARLVKNAERELLAAMKAATDPKPDGDGERKAA